MRRAGAIAALLGLAGSLSCFRPYCDRLEALARDDDIQAQLRAWVSENLPAPLIPADQLRLSDGFAPGMRWLDKTFDAELLGFGATAHVRVLGPGVVDLLNGSAPAPVDSVLFIERSRAGILVRAPGASRFGPDPEGIVPVADDVAVVCITDD